MSGDNVTFIFGLVAGALLHDAPWFVGLVVAGTLLIGGGIRLVREML